MSDINIVTPAGFGDAFTYSSIIKGVYARNYDRVYLYNPRVIELLEILYKDIPNVIHELGPPDADYVELNWHHCVAHKPSWRQVDWDRDLDKERACYDYFVNKYGSEYVITHSRLQDNAGFDMLPLNLDYVKAKDLPIINLDNEALVQNGDPVNFVTDYRMLIENAAELHLYEGNFSCMVAGLANIRHVPFYLHLYCKPYLFDWSNHRSDVLRFIARGDWMRDNVEVTYIYDHNPEVGFEYDLSVIPERTVERGLNSTALPQQALNQLRNYFT